jgi:hypothetical protein
MIKRKGWGPVFALPLASFISLLTRQDGFCVRADDVSICSGGNSVKFFCYPHIATKPLSIKPFAVSIGMKSLC